MRPKLAALLVLTCGLTGLQTADSWSVSSV